MAEFITTDVKCVKTVAKCECGGEFEPTGVCLTSYPCQYPHICNKCGKTENFHLKYPYIGYEEI